MSISRSTQRRTRGKSMSSKKSKTRSRSKSSVSSQGGKIKYAQHLICNLMNLKHSIKLFHWTTKNYSFHKITDDFLSKQDELIDQYVEVFLGLNGNKNKLELIRPVQRVISLQIKSVGDLLKKIETTIDLLNKHSRDYPNHELLALRDEMLAELQRFKYLLQIEGKK